MKKLRKTLAIVIMIAMGLVVLLAIIPKVNNQYAHIDVYGNVLMCQLVALIIISLWAI